MKEKGVEFNVKYSDEGHKLDWERWGNPGHAQSYGTIKKSWYRKISWMEHILGIFDFKPIKGRRRFCPIYNTKF